jgi:hypothetical protein
MTQAKTDFNDTTATGTQPDKWSADHGWPFKERGLNAMLEHCSPDVTWRSLVATAESSRAETGIF